MNPALVVTHSAVIFSTDRLAVLKNNFLNSNIIIDQTSNHQEHKSHNST